MGGLSGQVEGRGGGDTVEQGGVMVQAKKPRKIHPPELVALYLVVTEHPSSAPEEVRRIAQAIAKFVLPALNQKAVSSGLNRSFSQLRTHRPEMFPAILGWLNLESTNKLFLRVGEQNALRKLISSVERIIQCDMPHAALGMDQNKGPPPLWGFTLAEDAAACAQHLHLNKGESIPEAKENAAELFNTHRRDIERAKIPELTPDEAREWAELALEKYGIAL